jgi:hypothetical protein
MSLGQGKRYAFGALPIGDAFLAWSFAAPFDTTTTSFPPAVRRWWRMPWHVLTLMVAALLWLPVARALVRRVRVR